MNRNAVSASREDYLEAMYRLEREVGASRVRDLATRLSVKMPAVTAALRQLSAKGWVEYHPYETARLTEEGRTIALDVMKRHTVLRRFLVDLLGLDEETAERNACRMEHVIDPVVIRRMAARLKREAGGAEPAAGGDAS